MIPVRSLRISTRIFQRGANTFEKSMKRRASLDFPSGENNLVSPRTSPTESLPSSPSGLTFIRERIFLAGKREPAAVWPPLAAATFYRLITLLRPLPSSSSLLVLSLRLPRSVVSHGVGAKHGVEGRRVKTHTSHDVENTCVVWSSRPLLHPAVDGSADPPKWKTRRFEKNSSMSAIQIQICAWWMRFPQRFIQKRKRSKRKFQGFRDPSSWRKGL